MGRDSSQKIFLLKSYWFFKNLSVCCFGLSLSLCCFAVIWKEICLFRVYLKKNSVTRMIRPSQLGISTESTEFNRFLAEDGIGYRTRRGTMQHWLSWLGNYSVFAFRYYILTGQVRCLGSHYIVMPRSRISNKNLLRKLAEDSFWIWYFKHLAWGLDYSAQNLQ